MRLQTLETPETENKEETNPDISNEEKQKTITVDGVECVYDLDEPISLEMKFKALEQRLQVTGKSLNRLVTLQDKIQACFNSSFADVNKKLSEANQKFVIAGKLIESVMDAVEENGFAKKCEDDHKGLAILKGATM